jgi:hypothetical protein
MMKKQIRPPAARQVMKEPNMPALRYLPSAKHTKPLPQQSHK